MDGYIFHLPRERSRVRKDIRNNGAGEFVKGEREGAKVEENCRIEGQRECET